MARPLGDPGWNPSQRPSHRERRPLPDVRRWIGPLVLVLIAGAAVVLMIGGLPGVAQDPSPSPTAAASAVAQPGLPTPIATSPPTTMRPSRSPSAAPGTTAPEPSDSSQPTTSPSASPPATQRPDGAAPATAEEFQAAGEVAIDIEFPFKPGVRYRYRDNWLHHRPGQPEHYNHVRQRRGKVVRAHDGTDVYARAGTPVVASFAGQVIEPAERWQPWHPERYGLSVVIVSQEPLTEGYVAILAHLDATFVEPGEVVRRGEVIGLAGNSGNAEGGRAHLHFELRAPFVLEWHEAGERRLIDAFNPHPSLRAAEPDPAD